MYDLNDIDFNQLYKEMDQEACIENSGARDKKQKIEDTVKWSKDESTISINIVDLGITNSGPWLSYSFCSSGKNFEELQKNGWICETDQDGRIVKEYQMLAADREVREKCRDIIDSKLNASFLIPAGKPL